MLKAILSFVCVVVFISMTSAQHISKEAQVKLGIAAAPAELREGATVYGYADNGELVLIKKGTNDLICLSDNPNQNGLNVSCYHKDLEPFMARGRALKSQGKNQQEIFEIREQEVKAGTLKMPKDPSSLYVFTAQDDQYDASNGEISTGYLRYVIYIPYATKESTGLPLAPSAPGMPWIMDPGTHRAHIMINPPKN